MKNNFKIIFISLVVFFIIKENSLANDLFFKTNEITTSNNGNIIIATKGIVESAANKIIINAKKFKYNKISSILTADFGIANLLEENITIKADSFIYNEVLSTINATGNVTIKDLKKKILIQTENIHYNYLDKFFEADQKTVTKDGLGNIIHSDSFIYTLKDNLIKIEQGRIVAADKSIHTVEKAYINILLNKLIAKDLSIDFNTGDFQNNNEPRLKGKVASSDVNETVVTKGVFTTCKKNDTCPPWQLSAREIKHDKEKKIIFYSDAWLKIYDNPVFYFPKFFHPDPSVKRQTGFLMPTFKNSTSIGNSLHLPYFYAISDNKDITISPRLYSDSKILAQTEYREKNIGSNHLVDFSLFKDKKTSGKSHFFLKSDIKINLSYFDESELNINLQSVSNDTYLKTYKIKSPIISNYNNLNSSIEIAAYKESLAFSTNLEIYEDLSKKKRDRFEYILPKYNLIKEFKRVEKISGDFSLNSSGYVKNYETNILEKSVINDLKFESDARISNQGLRSNYNIILKNVNTDSKKSPKYKERPDYKLQTLIEYKSTYPLKKLKDGYTNIFKPTVSLRHSPNNSKNLSNDDRKINTNNVYSLNRIGTSDSFEGGSSLTYGAEYSKTNSESLEILNMKIANVFRNKEDSRLSRNSSLGKKTSDIFGSISYKPNQVFSIEYDFAQDDNMTDTNYEILKSQININKFVTSFEYLNENNLQNQEGFLSNKTSYEIDKSNKLSFETRENKKTKLTEFYNLIYQYRNDCLIAAIEYNKDYYSDRDLKPNENIFFKLTIVPFGQTSSPNLKKLK